VDIKLSDAKAKAKEKQARNKAKKRYDDDDSDDEFNSSSSRFSSSHPISLYSFHFRRVVLDESHTIRNFRTKLARCCCMVSAERRWAMTATPLHNELDDLYSTFAFLRFEPYACLPRYRALISKHSGGVSKGLDVLRTLLCIIAIRRTKSDTHAETGKKLVALPPKSFQIHRLEFTPIERTFYEELFDAFRERMRLAFGEEAQTHQASKSALTAGQHSDVRMSDMLVQLLRLRQTCDHYLLAIDGISQAARRTAKSKQRNVTRGSSTKASTKRSDRHMEDVVERACRSIHLRLRMQQHDETQDEEDDADSDDSDSSSFCGVCLDGLASRAASFTTPCDHTLCIECAQSALTDLDMVDDDLTDPGSKSLMRKVLRCPVEGCAERVSKNEMRKFLDERDRKRRQRMSKSVQSKQDSSTRTRSMPMMIDSVELLSPTSASSSSSPSSSPLTPAAILSTAKLSFVLSHLRRLKSSPATCHDKVVIFSIWTSCLDLIQLSLDEEQRMEDQRARMGETWNGYGAVPRPSYHYARLDGSQSSKVQSTMLDRFQQPMEDAVAKSQPPISIFLLSLKAGGTGLNLSAANHLILVDLWYNPAMEAQAFDRVYRVGQTKATFVHKLLIANSVEEQLYELQERKSRMAFGVLDAQRAGSGVSKPSNGNGPDGDANLNLGFKKGGVSMEELKAIFLGSQW